MRQLYEYHPTFGLRFIPGLKARVEHEAGGYLLRANQAGFRCEHEFVREKKPGTFRILLFGDSYTAGDGVSNRDRFGDRLEQLIPGVEVYNFGLPSTGTDQQYLVFRELAGQYDHDLIVLGLMVENIRRNLAHHRPFAEADGTKHLMAKPYFTLERSGELALHQVPVPRGALEGDADTKAIEAEIARAGSWSSLRRLVRRNVPAIKPLLVRWLRYQPLPEYNRADNPAWQLMQAIVRGWAAQSKVPMLVFPLPLYHYVEGSASPRGYRARMAELASPPQLLVHDPLDHLLAQPADTRRAMRFPRDVHPTPLAHQLLAESLATAVRPLVEGALVDGPPENGPPVNRAVERPA